MLRRLGSYGLCNGCTGSSATLDSAKVFVYASFSLRGHAVIAGRGGFDGGGRGILSGGSVEIRASRAMTSGSGGGGGDGAEDPRWSSEHDGGDGGVRWVELMESQG